jgi:hypothetical protein
MMKNISQAMLGWMLLFFSMDALAQYSLYLNGGFITISAGTSGTPAYLIVNEGASTGIYRPSAGAILTEGQYNLVKWNMQSAATSYTFPFGRDNTSARYVPFTFNKTSTGTAGVSISTKGSGIASDNTPYFSPITTSAQMTGLTGGTAANSVIDRWWQINVTSGTPTATLTFSYLGQENTTGFTDAFAPQRWNSVSSNWDAPTSSGTTGGNTTDQVYTSSVTGVSSFSPWILSRRAMPLPVTLLHFNGICKNGIIHFDWSTAHEINNDYFTIEKSLNGITYTPILTIHANPNNGANPKQYTATYSEHQDNLSYYRLKQTDYNHQFTYFKPLSVHCQSSSAEDSHKLVVVPGTSKNSFFVKMIGYPANEQVLVTVVDMVGKILFSKTILTDANGSGYEVLDNVTTAAKEIYCVVAAAKQESHAVKLLVE